MLPPLDTPEARPTPGEPELPARILAQLPVFVAVVAGPEYRYRFVNQTVARLLFGGRDCVGRTLGEVLPGDAAERTRELIDRVRATGERVVGAEMRGVARPEHFYNFIYEPLCPPAPSPTGSSDGDPADRDAVLMYAEDVTDQVRTRRRAEELTLKLEESQALLSTLFEQAPAGMGVWDEELRFLLVNRTLAELTGLPAGELRGRTLGELLPDLALPSTAALRRVFETGQPCQHELSGETPAGPGVLRAWHVQYYPVRVRERLLGVGAIWEEVTERRHAEAERDRLINDLARSNADLDQFAHVVSHDLKAPLRGIANLCQFIEDDLRGQLPENVRKHLTAMQERIRRLNDLIGGVLSYARAARVSSTQPVSVDALLSEVLDLLAPAPGVVVQRTTPMPQLVTERVPLQQVFLNLIGNALKHGRRPDLVIRLAARDRGASWEFEIEDNGPGIAPADQERIWGMFQMLGAPPAAAPGTGLTNAASTSTGPTGTAGTGTGIGLAVVKKLVETRGGRIWVSSEEGRGTSFRFTWPKAAELG
jgi:PAS domain S-box-containing protein